MLIAAVAMAASTVSAQTAYTFWSAEALAARAQSVFCGVVVNVKKLPVETGFAPKISITVRVSGVLKGRPDKTITLDGNIFGSREARFDLWKKSKAQFLWFDLGKDDNEASDRINVRGLIVPQPFQRWEAIRLSPPDPKEEALSNYAEAQTTGTFGMDLRVYKDPKKILSRVQRFLSVTHGQVPIVGFMIPPELAKGTGFDAGDNRLAIPITPESESIMLHLIDGPASVLGKDSRADEAVWIRSHAIRVLSYFKSAKNVVLLKSLLSDRGKGPGYRIPFAGDAPETYYWTRLAAYDVLKFWGVEVPMPDL